MDKEINKLRETERKVRSCELGVVTDKEGSFLVQVAWYSEYAFSEHLISAGRTKALDELSKELTQEVRIENLDEEATALIRQQADQRVAQYIRGSNRGATFQLRPLIRFAPFLLPSFLPFLLLLFSQSS